MRKLKVKYQVWRDGKLAGTLVRDKGGIRMHGACGRTVPDKRPLKEIIATLASAGCVLRVVRAEERRAA